MKLLAALETGAACVISTYGECVLNIELHTTNLFCYSEIDKELAELRTEVKVHDKDDKDEKTPQDIIDRVNKELEGVP